MDAPFSLIKRVGRSKMTSALLFAICRSSPAKLVLKMLQTYFLETNSNILPEPKPIETSLEQALKLFSNLHESKTQKENVLLEAEETSDGVAMKAVKADDANAEVSLWNIKLCKTVKISYQPLIHDKPLEVLREKFMMFWYRRLLLRSFLRYLRNEYGSIYDDFMNGKRSFIIKRPARKRLKYSSVRFEEMMKDIKAGHEVLFRCGLATFWEWAHGLRLIFWRWPREYQKRARDGSLPFLIDELPRSLGKQRWPQDENIQRKMIDKLQKVTDRRYIVPGYVLNLTNYFPVEKGKDDI